MVNFEYALTALAELYRARKFRTRPPENQQLRDAIRFLCNSRLQLQSALNRNEIHLIIFAYEHLQERDMILSDYKDALTASDLELILTALTLPSRQERYRSDTRTLAEMIREDQISKLDKENVSDTDSAFVTILARTGSAQEAAALLMDNEMDESIWVEALNGLILEQRIPEFWKLLENYKNRIGSLSPDFQEELVTSLIDADRTMDAQQLYESNTTNSEPTSKCMSIMLMMAIKSSRMALAKAVASEMSARLHDSDVIAALILYHAAEESDPVVLQKTIHELLASSHANVDISTFNDVIEYAALNNKPALALKIRTLAEAEGLQPDGKTHALALRHAIDAMQFAEAQQHYEAMQTQDAPDDNFDVSVMNRYIATISFAPLKIDYQLIMRIVENVLARGGELEPNAVAGLTHVFLHRDDLDELNGLLDHRIEVYTLADRARVVNVFRTFILDTTIKPQRAFNAYDVWRQFFPESEAELRIPIMQSFFDRKRPDLACQVFSHMRASDQLSDSRPDADAYTKAFEGIAQCRDVDGLQAIYNMLKLDLSVPITTKIRNGLMLANIACHQPWVAIIDHFYKIMDSREGPTYSSFEVAMRACETWPPYGSFESRKIMAVMQSWDLEITKPMYDNYIGVMAGQCEFENAVELIERMEEDIGEKPDAFTIGTFYNVIPWQYRKDEVEKWAKQAYPELWEELLTFGDEIDEEWHVRYFKLDRSIDIDDPPLFGEGEWKPELQQDMQTQIEPL